MAIYSDILITFVYATVAILFFIAYYERIVKKYTTILDGAKHVINGRFKRRFFEVVRLEGEYKTRKVIVEVDRSYCPIAKVKLNKYALNIKKRKSGGFLDPSYILSKRLLENEENFIAILDELSYICDKIEKGEFIVKTQGNK